MKVTQKQIKNSYAEDITNFSFEEIKELVKKERSLEEICYSLGVYGINGKILQGLASGKMYKICKRNTNIFAI